MNNYNNSEPQVLKFLTSNGDLVDENGNVIAHSDSLKDLYNKASPRVAKYLHSDGTIDENPGTAQPDIGIKTVSIDENNHLIFVFTDDSEYDAGEIDFPGKADKVVGAVEGNFANLTSEGNISDSGKSASNFMPVVSGGTAGNLVKLNSHGQVTDSEKKVSDFFENEYLDRIYNSVYAKLGRSFNNPEGYLRTGKKLNKIVILGNSLTGIEYTYTRQNGEEFSEQRELGCCHSEKQWICSIYRYLKANVNHDIKIYSAQCADWERDTAGNRQLSTVLGKNCYIAQDTVKVPTGGTLEDYLTEDTDIVIIDLYENISVSDTTASRNELRDDFLRLYTQIQTKCPKAKIYQFGGFMHNAIKSRVLNSICCDAKGWFKYSTSGSTENDYFIINPVPQMVFSPTWMRIVQQAEDTLSGQDYDRLLCVAGDTVYDVDGNAWTTIQNNWTSHPGDLGYQNIAVMMLYALYNAQCKNDIVNFVARYNSTPNAPVQYDLNFSVSADKMKETSFKPNGYTSISDYNDLLDYAMFPCGKWRAAAFEFDYNSSSATAKQASYVVLNIQEITSGNNLEQFIFLNNSCAGMTYSRCSKGTLFNTGSLKKLIDDITSDTRTTYSSAKIDAMFAGAGMDGTIFHAKTYTRINDATVDLNDCLAFDTVYAWLLSNQPLNRPPRFPSADTGFAFNIMSSLGPDSPTWVTQFAIDSYTGQIAVRVRFNKTSGQTPTFTDWSYLNDPELPALPTTDGTYVLKFTKSGSTKTLEWVAES